MYAFMYACMHGMYVCLSHVCMRACLYLLHVMYVMQVVHAMYVVYVCMYVCTYVCMYVWLNRIYVCEYCMFYVLHCIAWICIVLCCM